MSLGHITAQVCVCASGRFLPSMVIFQVRFNYLNTITVLLLLLLLQRICYVLQKHVIDFFADAISHTDKT